MLLRNALIVLMFLVLGGGSYFISSSYAQEPDMSVLHPPLSTEGIYDPENPGLEYLQQPADALRDLPTDKVGNFVDWVRALNDNYIEPRTGLKENSTMRAVNMDVRMSETASMPFVTFPHYTHTQWLTCSNCHTKIFLPKKNANPVNMYDILQGKYCGVCHGKVAFPLFDCFRCHNTPRDTRVLPTW